MDFNERENALVDEAEAYRFASLTDEERAEDIAFVEKADAKADADAEARRLASVDDGIPF
tara:strand:+ start:699 stop:878 length:180 start_codon:yes stop_codon:yes gene_type:complete